jgi:hypothetical protein
VTWLLPAMQHRGHVGCAAPGNRYAWLGRWLWLSSVAPSPWQPWSEGWKAWKRHVCGGLAQLMHSWACGPSPGDAGWWTLIVEVMPSNGKESAATAGIGACTYSSVAARPCNRMCWRAAVAKLCAVGSRGSAVCCVAAFAYKQ